MMAIWDRRGDLEKALGVRFRNRELLRRALTHRSYAHEAGLDAEDTNERLEFLGDAILDLVISEYMYNNHDQLDEGELTRIRSFLVNANSLAEVAGEIGLGRYILLSREEKADKGGEKASILADALEAVIAAVHLDRGIGRTREMVIHLFGKRLEDAVSGPLDNDYKSQLQEMMVKERGMLPKYRLSEEGPDHRKVFYATVYVEGENLGKGCGTSKKEAEQAAACEALNHNLHSEEQMLG
ncbi:MAG: ribonuclease III [Actinomycetota bacterium]|nr:ribonuclease III [Actinomycetota bacterium]